jgi:hypothetical protein
MVHPTTGNASFAEGLRLYRGLNLGHSAKTLFAEGQPQEPSAKTGPRQRGLLPKAWPSAKKGALGKVGPLGHGGQEPVRLCRGLSVRPSAKFFFKKNSVFVPIFFITGLCRGPPLPRAPCLALDKDPLCRGPRQRFFIFLFFEPIFCAVLKYVIFEPKFKIWSNFDLFKYIFLV